MTWDPFKEVTDRLERHVGGNYFCPAHDDQMASLSVNPGRDGRALVRCHRRPPCEIKDITGAIGLTVRDLFPRNGAKSGAATSRQPTSTIPRRRAAAKPRTPARVLSVEPVQLYDADGNYVVTQLRVIYDTVKPSGKHAKTFSYRYRNGRRCTLKSLGLKSDDLPLWNSEKLRERPNRIVVITEGVKAAQALINALAQAGLGDAFVVLATVGGAEVLPCAYRLECLRDRVVWLWPDNDEGGRAHMNDLECWAPAAETRTIMTDCLPEGGDAADYFERGGTILDMLEAVR